jgi:Zn-dependent protease
MEGAAGRCRARALVARVAEGLRGHPLLSVLLTVLSFSFFGPLAALVLVATMLDHEFAHRYLMQRLGYAPGPVQVIPFVGAAVRAGRPMRRSAHIVLIYLAGPLAGVLSAASAALLASRALSPALAHEVTLGAAVSIALNLFNLIPIEPLDGGLIARVLPYPALLLFPGAVALWLWRHDVGSVEIEALAVIGTAVLMALKVRKWHAYVAELRGRAAAGDADAQSELEATFDIPLVERAVVVAAYLVLVPSAVALLEALSRDNGWLAL